MTLTIQLNNLYIKAKKHHYKTRIMKKLIYAPVPEQQVIYIDKEIAVINDDKVIYLKPYDISDMLYLYMILDEWKLADIYKRIIIDMIADMYDNDNQQ